jgi:prepilin-type N-terminal cleavage/methylation domain-containing protein
MRCQDLKLGSFVIPGQARIQRHKLDSRLGGNDGTPKPGVDDASATAQDEAAGGASRAGYTLIELLIASVLVATLMSAVWGLMSMYNTWLTAGQTETASQQLSRSLFELIRNDIMSVAASDPVIANHRGRSGRADGSISELFTDAEMSSEERPADLASSDEQRGTPGIIVPRTLLRGTARWMQVVVIQPPESPDDINNTDTSAESGGSDRTESPVTDMTWSDERIAPDVAEFQTITYQFESPVGGSSSMESLPSGLHRFQSETLRFQTIMESLSTQDSEPQNSADQRVQRTSLELLSQPNTGRQGQSTANEATALNSGSHFLHETIREVDRCRFQYFDGQRWLAAWDSQLKNSLPAAIRIQIALTTEEERLQTRSDRNDDSANIDPSRDEESVDPGLEEDMNSQQADTAWGTEDSRDLMEQIIVLRPSVFRATGPASNESDRAEPIPVTAAEEPPQ